MAQFYVMINSDTDSDLEKNIKKIFKTEYEYIRTFGVYDVIVKVKYQSARELADKIKVIPKVRSVMILTSVS